MMEKIERIHYLENKEKKIDDYESSFWVEPLERGFANTIGNALRRVLLSSITSVAPFAVKIKNVVHEFVTLSGLIEDVPRLLLNIRQIKFNYNPDILPDDEILVVSYHGNSKVGYIHAKDLNLPTGIQINNPEQIICETSKKNVLQFEIYIRSGRGFVDFEENKKFIEAKRVSLISEITTGEFLAIDSDFTPIVSIRYATTELNNESLKIQERLTIDIRTDGTVKAKDALGQASQILIAHLSTIANIDNLDSLEIFKSKEEIEDNSKLNTLTINDLELSIRSLNALKRSKHIKVSEVAELTLDELKNIKNLGEKSVTEIIEKLNDHGISLNKGDD